MPSPLGQGVSTFRGQRSTLAVLYLQEVKYLLLDVTLSTVSKAYAATRTSTLAARTQSPERRKWRTHGPLLS